MIKQVIIEILTENPAGLSLAQLPLHIKYKLPFPLDLNELGFVKLKELLSTMSGQVKIELRGHNHPFARLCMTPSTGKLKSVDFCHSAKNQMQVKGCDFVPQNSSGYPVDQIYNPYVDFNKQLEMIRTCIYSLLREFQPGIDSTKLPLLLYTRLGISFDWYVFGCSTLCQFLQKYVSPYFEIEIIPINTYDADHFVLRLKETARNNTPYYCTPYYPVHYRFDTDPNIMGKYPPGMVQPEGHSVDLTNKFHSMNLSGVAHEKSQTSSISIHAQSISDASSSKNPF